MSAKRTSGDGGQNDAGSGLGENGRQEDNAKRVKTSIEIQLVDLPTELLHLILIKAITMEVKNMKLIKSVWKEKADLVISRLGSVCSQWSNVLTTDFFRLELHRALDGMDDVKIRMEILYQYPILLGALSVACIDNDVYILRRDLHKGYVLDIYDSNTTPLSKDVLRLTEIVPYHMVSCPKSKSLFMVAKSTDGWTMMRVIKTGAHMYQTTNWIRTLHEPVSAISISRDGHLTLVTNDLMRGSTLLSFDPDGHLECEIKCKVKIVERFESAFRKSNGNFVIVQRNSLNATQLLEIDRRGAPVRLLDRHLPKGSRAYLADCHGRIIIDAGSDCDLILIDQEFNSLTYAGPQTPGCRYPDMISVELTSDLHQMHCVVLDIGAAVTSRMVSFRFAEIEEV